jgi:hypothetical protein
MAAIEVNDNLASGYLSTAIGGDNIAGRLNSVDYCLLSSTLRRHQTVKMPTWFLRPNKLRDAKLACEWAQSTAKLFASTSPYYYALQSL